MKYGSELKIGLTGLFTVIIIIWGVNFLKGRNILKSNYLLFAQYDMVDGLEASANVMLDGFKIGTVDDVIFETEKQIPFTVILELNKDYKIRAASTAEISSADLLGTKEIKIIQSKSLAYVEHGDTLRSEVSGDLIASLLDEISPLITNISTAVITLDSLGTSINALVQDPAMIKVVDNLEGFSSSLNNQLSSNGDISKTLAHLEEITKSISSQNEAIKNTISNLDSISGAINNSNLELLIADLSTLGSNLSDITESINQGEGSLGKLINEDSLYNQINLLISNLDSLIIDVNENPKKYVHFSLFGK